MAYPAARQGRRTRFSAGVGVQYGNLVQSARRLSQNLLIRGAVPALAELCPHVFFRARIASLENKGETSTEGAGGDHRYTVHLEALRGFVGDYILFHTLNQQSATANGEANADVSADIMEYLRRRRTEHAEDVPEPSVSLRAHGLCGLS